MGITDIVGLLRKHGPNLLRMLENGVTGTNFSAALLPPPPAMDVSGLRDDINGVSRAQAGLVRHLQDQTLQLSSVEEEVKRLRMALEHSERRIEGVERELSSISLWVKALGITTVVLLIVFIVMAFVLHARPA
ncbi:MAG: hypothetical protein P4L10_10010 [Acidobacteriaceae bacterium]|jgi:hypothetical protein|nr:hypothetical protein [Acidobacteriaceae bacterium]